MKLPVTAATGTSTRPNETSGDCGYWTFLPYYAASCGFYITAVNAEKRIPQDEQCGGLYCETTPFTCSSDYDITFSCTNTTYLDSNGDAQGITIFVATDCDTNERLDVEQDPRYEQYNEVAAGLVSLSSAVLNATSSGDDGPYYTRNPDPTVLPTCLRGCLCGYSHPTSTFYDASVYPWCDCEDTLANIFWYLAITQETQEAQGPLPPGLSDLITQRVYTTPTNLSMLLLYGIQYYNFNKSLEAYDAEQLWVNISEGSNLTLQKGFDCFGDKPTNISALDT